ncbi:MAG: hypothetical protein WKG32_19895, partial [Gemmatimonadaceae bacterium]
MRFVVPTFPRRPRAEPRPARAGPPAKPSDIIAGPIRGELLGADRLAGRARGLAHEQRVAQPGDRRRIAPLLERLDETRGILDRAHERLAAAAERDLAVGPAAEWLLDNYHVVDEHLREVRESLPRGYYRELPQLASGPLAGYPRVYEIAITLISHTEARIDLEQVELVVGAFQEVRALSIGELWALPAMLRLGLIESVRRMALRTVARLSEVEEADRWAARLHDAMGRDADALSDALNALVASPPVLGAAFVSRFLQQLRATDSPFTPLAWIEQWIAEDAMSAEEASSRAARRLAQTQVAMANSIMSLRAVGRMDWPRFIERSSRLEAVLRGDPAGHYPRMTFGTRDHYRHVVEGIAKRTGEDEVVVAMRAVALARAAASEGASETTDTRRAHVGFYLVADGRVTLERAMGYRPGPREWVHRWVLRHPNIVFVGGILASTLATLAAVLWLGGPAARAAWPAVLLVALIPASEIAARAVNQLVTAFLPPRTLPKLDFGARGADGGIPAEYRTAVVVPTLFGSVRAVEEALEHLEVQFLANREAELRFALLTDFIDAGAESAPGDDAIIAAAAAGVRALNARYGDSDGDGGEDPFYLFHRPRRLNPRQGVWMGWERKRGKLGEFNRFLRGDASAERAFSAIVGDVRGLRGVRYVITLDSDTMLPPGAAALLIGTLAHP